MAKPIEEIAAAAEIRDVHIRYCRANDRRDEMLLRSCFHTNAIIELHKPLQLEEFIALNRTAMKRYTVTWHNTGNQLVELSGTSAWAEHYTVSSHRIAADADGPIRDFLVLGRYVDHMAYHAGEWRIARRRLLIDFTRTDPVHKDNKGASIISGIPGPDDPSSALKWRD